MPTRRCRLVRHRRARVICASIASSTQRKRAVPTRSIPATAFLPRTPHSRARAASPESIEAMGSKTEARQRMKAAGVPVVPGLTEPVRSFEEIAAFARTAGLPIMIKASAGGGGKGLRFVEREEDLQPSFERVTSEAQSFFGDAAVYAEKFVPSPRHIEVQILGDQHGNLLHVGERECTLQRRHQKVVEECPSPVVDDELRAQLGAMAVKAAAAVRYYSAGTIECLMGPD